MQQVYHLFSGPLKENKNYLHNYFQSPIRSGAFAVKLNVDKARALAGPPEEFYFKFSLDKFNYEGQLDLKPSEGERLANDQEILKINGDLKPILDYILANKHAYLFRPRSQLSSSSNDLFKSFSRSRTNSSLETESVAFTGSSVAFTGEAVSSFCQTPSSDAPSRSSSLTNLGERFSRLNFHRPGAQFQRRRKRKILATDFVSFRSTMAILLNCQYDSSKTFTILAEEFEGTIYLKLEKLTKFISDLKKDDDLAALVDHNYARRKFENHCTKEFSREEKSILSGVGGDQINATVKEDRAGEAFRRRATHNLLFMFKGQISRHSMLYAATMDCFEKYQNLTDEIDSKRLGAVQFKTSKQATTDKQKNRFKRTKTLLWWSQAVLVNAKIAVAMWKNDFVANEVREYSIDDLVEIGSGWNPKICFYQLNRILSFIKESFEINYNVNLLKFHHEKGSKKIVCEESDKRLLPEYYKDQLSGRPSNWRS